MALIPCIHLRVHNLHIILLTGVITFNTAIQDGVTDHDGDPPTIPDQGDGTVDLTVVLSPMQSLTQCKIW